MIFFWFMENIECSWEIKLLFWKWYSGYNLSSSVIVYTTLKPTRIWFKMFWSFFLFCKNLRKIPRARFLVFVYQTPFPYVTFRGCNRWFWWWTVLNATSVVEFSLLATDLHLGEYLIFVRQAIWSLKTKIFGWQST